MGNERNDYQEKRGVKVVNVDTTATGVDYIVSKPQ